METLSLAVLLFLLVVVLLEARRSEARERRHMELVEKLSNRLWARNVGDLRAIEPGEGTRESRHWVSGDDRLEAALDGARTGAYDPADFDPVTRKRLMELLDADRDR